MPGACGLRPCARTHLKKALYHTCSLGWASNKYRSIVILHLSSCRVALPPAVFTATLPSLLRSCRVCLGIWRFLRLQEAFPLCFYLFRGGRLVPEAPLISGMPTGLKMFLAMPTACGLRPCAQTHLKKGLVPHLSVRCQYPPSGPHVTSTSSNHFTSGPVIN